MSYFYIVKNSTDLGFGVTGNYESRAQDYVSHAGPNSGAYFPYVFTGYTPHINKLESTIKRQWIDRTFVTNDGWKTEWLLGNETLDNFVKDVLELIKERHWKIEIYETDYDFLNR